MTYAIRTILLATDLGPRSQEVLAHALGIARRFEARLHLLTVMQSASDRSMVALDNYLPDEVIPKLREDAIRRIRERVEQLLAAAAVPEDVVGSVQVLEGRAGETVLNEAQRLGAELIVLGSHGHTALGEMLVGSVAHQVSAAAQVPVLLVPIKE